MAELFIGAGVASGFLFLVRAANERGIRITPGQWIFTLLGFLYCVFVLEVVVSFLREGTPKGAAVMGTVMGFVAVVWAVLLVRNIFSRSVSGTEAPGMGGGSHA
jgi:hypothetical protein